MSETLELPEPALGAVYESVLEFKVAGFQHFCEF